MPTGDPDIDAAFGGSDAAPASHALTGDADIDSAFKSAAPTAQKESAPNPYRGLPQDMNPEEGVLTLDTAKHAFGQLAGGFRDSFGAAMGDKKGTVHGTAPANDIDRAVRLVGGLLVPTPGMEGAAAPVAEAATHPLAGAAQAEIQRIADIHAQGTAAGFDMPVGASAARTAKAAGNNQPLSNAAGRQELNLPANAPLTPQLLTKARQLYASPGYEAVKGIPDPIPLDAQQQAALNDVRPLVGGRVTLPEGNSITGQQAVDLSKKLRARAAQLDKAQGITASGDIPADLADAHRDAAEAIEDATKSHLENTGRGDLAKNWDAARVYTAKTYSVQDALDGAGNINATKLKQQLLKAKPLSGNLEMLATLAARHPDAFRLTPETAAAPGMLRRGASAVAPSAGAFAGEAIGSALGAPGLGSIIGAGLGKSAAEKIVPP